MAKVLKQIIEICTECPLCSDPTCKMNYKCYHEETFEMELKMAGYEVHIDCPLPNYKGKNNEL